MAADRQSRPAEADLWTIRPAGAQAKKQWQRAMEAEPELMEKERHRLRERPLDRDANPRRTHQLRGPLGSRTISGKKLPQWQHEITGAGRVWYCPDKEVRVVWVTYVSLQHPQPTN